MSPPLDPERLDARIGSLPSLPDRVNDALDLLRHAEPDYHRVARTIAEDPGLSGRVLQLSNSAFYGFAGRIGSILEACLVLGTQTLRQIVTAAAVTHQFPERKGTLLDHQALWHHATCVGVVSSVLARRRGLDAGEAYTAGLLHDVGKLVLDTWFREEYSPVVAWRDAQDCLLRDAEEAVLGLDHGHVGALLASHWRFPKSLRSAIARHHAPDTGEPEPLVDCVHTADVLCRGLGLGCGGDDLVPTLAPGAWARMGLQWEDLPGVLSETAALAAADERDRTPRGTT